jgi:GNAT superfamily N-acetyltransferase
VHEASIRELDPERDPEAVVALIRESDPLVVISVAGWVHRFRTTPARAEQRAWVAELDGRVVGYVFGFKNFFTRDSTTVFGRVVVDEAHRRRGIGTALHDRLADHASALSAGSTLAHFLENPAGVAFATRLGYHEARAEQESVLDPRVVSEAPPPELELRTLADADPHDVYDVDLTATRDVPLTEPVDDIPYDEWEDHVLGHPHFTADGSFLAYVDGEPAAVSILLVDLESGRAANMFTGTLPRFRGRGLGLAVKLASIAWAKEHGITSMATTNDERNAPMLAINRKLGYVPAGRQVEYVRAMETASAPAPPAPAT